MFTGRHKIRKSDGAEPSELEASIAQEFFNLEVINYSLSNIYIYIYIYIINSINYVKLLLN
jgi:hypothetical protein